MQHAVRERNPVHERCWRVVIGGGGSFNMILSIL
jgi:hypothetical protein